MLRLLVLFAVVWGWAGSLAGAQLDEAIAAKLQVAGANRAELEQALAAAPAEHQASMKFLVAWLPEQDAQAMKADRLLENVALAEQVRQRLPWQKHIPDEIFLNHVLPHACLDEPRDPWRKEFLEKFWPLVENSRSAGEAAQILNEKIFALLKVKYSTERRRANQSPAESMAQGLASCSGLSILLVDACRAVGVPARVAGIPLWANKSGNHTWVEVWDGQWHFTGAAEFDPAGLDRAWFAADAARADPENPRHGIFATSYAPTELHFPLVWNRQNRSIPAENVTVRYLAPEQKQPLAKVRTFFRAGAPDGRSRIGCAITVTRIETASTPEANSEEAKPVVAPEIFSGSTTTEADDRNHLLNFELEPETRYRLTWQTDAIGPQTRDFQTGTTAEQRVEWRVWDPLATLPEMAAPETFDREKVGEFARRWFAADEAGRDELAKSATGQAWPGDSRELRELLWQALRESGTLDSLRNDLAASRITSGEHTCPYKIKDVGERPVHGWPLVIAMHGGGNAPQELNDSQWEHMQIYYRDHPEVSGYRYLALRAPNNTWNGFYDNYVYPLIMDLIVQQVAWNDVDRERVYLIGYSHGGYGAFAIGPKMPDLFAAIHASASAGTDGETSPTGLHSTRFTWMVGGRDTAFGRRERCEKFEQAVAELRGTRIDRYPAQFFLKERSGHGGLPDRDWLVEMLPWQRKLLPRELDWELTDPVVRHHYWLSVEQPEKGQSVSARFTGPNRIEVATRGRNRLTLWLDQRLVDPAAPLEVVFNGTVQTMTLRPTLADLCTSLLARRDPFLAAPLRVDLETPASAK